MARYPVPLLAGLLLLVATAASAAEGPAGTWKASFAVETTEGERVLTVLLMFSEQDGKWVGDFLDANPRFSKDDPAISDLTVKDDLLKFGVKVSNTTWTFEGKTQSDGKAIKGTMDLGGQTVLVDMSPTRLKSLTKDRFAVARETLDTTDRPAEFFKALAEAAPFAAAKKLKPEEMRAYADKAAKLAEPYGARWQRTVALRLADVLGEQEPFVGIAVEQARQAERLINPRTDDIATQLHVLDTLGRVYRKAKRDAEAKDVDAKVAKLEPRDYLEYVRTMPPFKPDEFKGRKGKSDRAVLVELFTGAECGPCVAVDLAFDSLRRTYKPSDVIFLQYHQHIPGPDPLVSKDGSTRFDYYAKTDDDKAAPMLFFNGKQDGSGGGAQPRMAKLKYQGYREAIDELLEKPAPVKLSTTASRKGDEISIKAVVSDLEKPGDKVSLRFALAEERIRYQGGNGIRYHHAVVRAMPGGPKGFPLLKASAEQSVTVKLDQVWADNNKSLDEFAADFNRELKKQGQGGDFTFRERPMDLRNLKVVAFVQNDDTKEVLQAVQVDLEAAKE